MIPNFGIFGCLPPFTGKDPAERVRVSPYAVSASDFIRRFANSDARRQVAAGLLEYRAKLKALGVTDGFQWLDGSFVEDCETFRGRPPKDIDVVTFASRPPSIRDSQDWRAFYRANIDTFDPENTKTAYSCDAYFIDLGKTPRLIVSDTAYFYGLFSHQRYTLQWKGMVFLPLSSDDDVAKNILQGAEDVQAP